MLKTKKSVSMIVVLILAVIALVICFKKDNLVTFSIEGNDFSIDISGNQMILCLSSNPTTGYTWTVKEMDDYLKVNSIDYMAADNQEDLTGVGGYEEIHITALKNGTGKAILEYKQDWEGGEIDGSYQLNVVSTNYGKKIRIKGITLKNAGQQ